MYSADTKKQTNMLKNLIVNRSLGPSLICLAGNFWKKESVEELVTGLSRVSWEKVDVSFHNSRSSIASHSVIQVNKSSAREASTSAAAPKVCQIKGCLPPVFVDPESSTQTDETHSSQVPVPLPEDPYEAIRQAYLDGMDTEFKPFEDIIDTETLESPFAIAPPIPLFESTPPVLFPILRRTARIVVCVPPAMSSGLFASTAKVASMSQSALRKRFRSSYESSSSVSPPDLPSRKCYRGTSELVEDSEEDDEEEDEEIEESMDSNSVSEDAEDEGPTAEDEDPAAEDEGLTTGVKGPDMDDKGYGLDDESYDVDEDGHSVQSDGLGLEEEEEAVPGGQQPTLTTWTDPEGGVIYIDIPDYPPPAPPVQPSPEWTSGLLPISPSHSDVPSPISSPMIPSTVPSPVATPIAVETEGILTELGAQVEMQGD
ncbi:hypothetical protein Tco_1132027 [Tanacetum coccineum]|uniref:Uncharacterized protein n=1 Tax=Tanacetum coccineum TaxID=301880 RepID=A0ABQ5JBD9_9ASTR